MADRISQAPVEVISADLPLARVTQDAIEVVNTAAPAARLTQFVIEVIHKPALPRAQIVWVDS